MHSKNYQKSLKKLAKLDEDVDHIAKLTSWLKRNPIKCYRYSNKLGHKLHIPDKCNAYL